MLEAVRTATSPATEERDALVGAAMERVKGLFDLAGAELRLIAISVFAMLFLVVLAATALLVAWGLVVASLLQFAASTAIPWSVAAIVLALGHLILAMYCWQRMQSLGRHFTMPELRRALHSGNG